MRPKIYLADQAKRQAIGSLSRPQDKDKRYLKELQNDAEGGVFCAKMAIGIGLVCFLGLIAAVFGGIRSGFGAGLVSVGLVVGMQVEDFRHTRTVVLVSVTLVLMMLGFYFMGVFH